MNEGLVFRVLKASGLTSIWTTKKRIDYRAHPRCDAALILQLREQGNTFYEIANKFGVTQAVVSRVFHSVR